MPDDVLERAKALIQKALDANAEERKRLQSSLGHMSGSGTVKRQRRPAKKPQRQRVSPGERKRQVLAELEKGPGKAAELARRATIASTGIYPVLRRLTSDGLVTKDGSVYALATNAPKAQSRTKAKARSGRGKARRRGSGASPS